MGVYCGFDPHLLDLCVCARGVLIMLLCYSMKTTVGIA